jgi:hypothetical protein
MDLEKAKWQLTRHIRDILKEKCKLHADMITLVASGRGGPVLNATALSDLIFPKREHKKATEMIIKAILLMLGLSNLSWNAAKNVLTQKDCALRLFKNDQTALTDTEQLTKLRAYTSRLDFDLRHCMSVPKTLRALSGWVLTNVEYRTHFVRLTTFAHPISPGALESVVKQREKALEDANRFDLVAMKRSILVDAY